MKAAGVREDTDDEVSLIITVDIKPFLLRPSPVAQGLLVVSFW